MPRGGHVLIASLGDSPAVITESRDELSRAGVPVTRVVTLYTKAMKRYFTLLSIDFLYGEYGGRVELVGVPLEMHDVERPEDCLYYRGMLLRTVRREMEEGPVHLLISGGRKSMAVDATLVALACGLSEVYHVKLPRGGVIRGESIPSLYDLERYLSRRPPESLMNQITSICHPKIRESILLRIELPILGSEERIRLEDYIASRGGTIEGE